ncbi:MAG: cytochrome c3 family protein [Kiritimatiellae bacterium]|nr:cytochrome c3 family protein [Kiritimatiellia bacterium]
MKRHLTFALALAAGAAFAAVPSHWDGGRNTPVHRLALNDEFGDAIVPGASGALPMSTRKTCGQCHDYDVIASGWHFNMSSTNAVAGRPAQPWFLIDPLSGSQIPMSLRGWPGTYRPKQIGMTDWEWVYAFGRHLPGGDIAAPADLYAEGGPRARWDVSGPVEINCFACHSQSKMYDHSEWTRLILRQNFRWAATGASGLGEILGMGSRVADYWGVLRGLNRDDAVYAVPPHVAYDVRQFDAKNRAVLDVGAPRSENCLNCHSTSQAGMPHKDIDGDVHLRAGMTCADCHGNGADHAVARGFEGDNTGKMDKTRATASCVGCHLGSDVAKAGRHGAPAPKHTGIPTSHFSTLACTACHSGVTENGDLAQVRTSRANRMGVYGRARWATPQPFILEPVFAKNAQGKIEPRRMAWPAFWGTRDAADAAKIVPLLPEAVAATCEGLLDVREQVGAALATLATDPNNPGLPVLAVDGKLFRKNVDGRAEPAGEAAAVSGWFYQGATNLIDVIPAYDADANTEKMTDEQLIARQDSEKKLSNLLQTLDASAQAAKRGFGAVMIGDKLFFRGGENDAMISTNAPVKAGKPLLGWYRNGAFEPLVSDYTACNVKELGGSECTVTEDMVAAGLKRLADKGQKRAVYVAHGQVWELAADGKLTAKVEKAADAVSWPVGHDVRPARMARGAKPAKCADCHTVDSKFFFAKVTSTGPLLTSRTLVKAQNEFMSLSGSYNKVFGATFLMRPFFKIFLWAVFAIVLLVAVAFVAAAVPVVLAKGEIPYGKPGEKLIVLIDKLAAVGLCAASVYLGVSGALGWFFHLMTGYVLVFHMVAGGLFAACLVALIWFRGARRITNVRRNLLWMLVMVLGVGVLFTAVAPMMTWFGEGWQHVMTWAHRCTTFSFLAVSAWMLLTGGRKE